MVSIQGSRLFTTAFVPIDPFTAAWWSCGFSSPPWLRNWLNCESSLTAASTIPPSRPPATGRAGIQTIRTAQEGSGRKRGGKQGHSGAGPELLPIEWVDAVVEHHPDTCRHCGTLLEGEDPEPLRHQSSCAAANQDQHRALKRKQD